MACAAPTALLHRLQFFQHAAQLGGLQGIGAVGLGFLGIVVDFHEDAIHACGDGRAGQHRNELGLAAADGVIAVGGGGRQLHRMRGVENDRRELAHDGQRPHVHHEIVVAEAGAALGHEDLVVAGGAAFLDDVPHVPGRDELAFLDVHHALGHARPRRPDRSGGRETPESAGCRRPRPLWPRPRFRARR